MVKWVSVSVSADGHVVSGVFERELLTLELRLVGGVSGF